jgi:hypothetical protein
MTPNYTLIPELSESWMFPSKKNLEKLSAEEVMELTHLYVVALRILFEEDDTESWVHSYAIRTLETGGNFARWRVNGTDLYHLLHALHGFREDGTRIGLRNEEIVVWLRDIKLRFSAQSREPRTRKLFLRLDNGLKITDQSMRAVRRLVMDWPDLTGHQRKLAMTRLIQLIRKRTLKCDILVYLERLARLKGFDDTSESLGETATSGSTAAGSVATLPGGLGAGFDPNGHKGIYEPSRSKKPIVLKRT